MSMVEMSVTNITKHTIISKQGGWKAHRITADFHYVDLVTKEPKTLKQKTFLLTSIEYEELQQYGYYRM